MEEKGINLYQELQMNSQFVNSHRDVNLYGEDVQLHSHTFTEFILCCSGDIEYLLGVDRYRIRKGDLIAIPPGVTHRPIFRKKEEAECRESYARTVIWISGEMINACKYLWPNINKELGIPLREHRWDDPAKVRREEKGYVLHLTGERGKYIETLFEKICREAELRHTGWEAVMAGSSLELLVLLARILYNEKTVESEHGELLDEVIGYVNIHMQEKITLQDTASHFLVSQRTLSQLFRDRMNVSFYHFVTQRRLIAAKLMIVDNVPMNAVCEQVGFNDYSAFYRAFKQEYNMSPTEYRDRLSEK